MIKDAVISDCGLYRYTLERTWDEAKKTVCFVLLNPSTADANKDDHTLRKGVGFAKRWGYGALVFVNLFALRATKPKCMKAARHPVGPMNGTFVLGAVGSADRVVLAWGTHGSHRGRDKEVLAMLEGLAADKLYHLGLTKDGHPKHPLTLSYATELLPWTTPSSALQTQDSNGQDWWKLIHAPTKPLIPTQYGLVLIGRTYVPRADDDPYRPRWHLVSWESNRYSCKGLFYFWVDVDKVVSLAGRESPRQWFKAGDPPRPMYCEWPPGGCRIQEKAYVPSCHASRLAVRELTYGQPTCKRCLKAG